MAALDTNIVVRLIIGDDAKQARAAEKLVAVSACTIAPTVLMECEWVLRAGYQLNAKLIAASMRDLLSLQNIEATEPVIAQQTLQGYEAGLDFADALHAAQRPDGETFATFDKKFVQRAPKAGVRGVMLVKT